MVYDKKVFYDDLPLLPPNIDLESKDILKKCLSATRQLAELKGAGDLIPNQSILINAIPLQEAQLSSEIENIVTTSDELFKASLDEIKVKNPAVKEVLRYRSALKYGFDQLAQRNRTVSLDLIKEIGSKLMGDDVKLREDNQNVYIGDPLLKIVHYTPPRGGGIVRDKLTNMIDFLNTSPLDPLIKIAVAHYQFEAIHPFTDGNGRTGRIINILLLMQFDQLKIPVLYLSRYIIKRGSTSLAVVLSALSGLYHTSPHSSS